MLNIKTDKCRFCEIAKAPRSYFDWVYYEDDNCVIGNVGGQDPLCVYKVHGELPGGHKLNEMMIRIGALMDGHKEYMQYVDHGHYRIWIRKKGDNNEKAKNLE